MIVQLPGPPKTRITLPPALAAPALAKECSVAVQDALKGVDLKAPPPDLHQMLAEVVRPFQQRDDGVWSNLVEGQQHLDVHVAEGCVCGDGEPHGEFTSTVGDFTEVVAYGLAASLLRQGGEVTRSRARKCTEESCKRGARARGRAESQCDHLSKEEEKTYRVWLLEHMRSHPKTLYVFNGRWVAGCFTAADLKILRSRNFLVVPHLSLACTSWKREAIKRHVACAGGNADLFESAVQAAPSKRRAPIFKGADAGGAFLLQSTSKALGPEHREKIYLDAAASSATVSTHLRSKRRRLDGSSQQGGYVPSDFASVARSVPRGSQSTHGRVGQEAGSVRLTGSPAW